MSLMCVYYFLFESRWRRDQHKLTSQILRGYFLNHEKYVGFSIVTWCCKFGALVSFVVIRKRLPKIIGSWRNCCVCHTLQISFGFSRIKILKFVLSVHYPASTPFPLPLNELFCYCCVFIVMVYRFFPGEKYFFYTSVQTRVSELNFVNKKNFQANYWAHFNFSMTNQTNKNQTKNL